MAEETEPQHRGPSYRNRDFHEIPFLKPKERQRVRDDFASQIHYEDWVAGDVVTIEQKRSKTARAMVKKLEDDSDFPVREKYFWPPFCQVCRKDYNNHVPPMWLCTSCHNPTWQPDEDPESSRCILCKKPLSTRLKMMIGGKKLKFRNPLGNTGAHHCRRCGRIVCPDCLQIRPVPAPEYGWENEIRVCKFCVVNIADATKPPPGKPDSDDDEDVGMQGGDDMLFMVPHWPPKCPSCKQRSAAPPKQWKCTSCKVHVWQPQQAEESNKCYVCDKPRTEADKKEKHPQCHRCGHIVCAECGSYKMPLVDLGWTMGQGMRVCKLCFGITKQKEPDLWPPKCPACSRSFPKPPKQWIGDCHRRPVWQPIEDKLSNTCAMCFIEIGPEVRKNCHLCGKVVCPACSPFEMPMVDMGFPPGQGKPVCVGCFEDTGGCAPNHAEQPFWIAFCHRCGIEYPNPPPRWQCPKCTGMTWQPKEHISSQVCWSCHGKVKEPSINCRACGRLVCEAPCGQKRREVGERGFTAGIEYPVCIPCSVIEKEAGHKLPAGGGGGGGAHHHDPTNPPAHGGGGKH